MVAVEVVAKKATMVVMLGMVRVAVLLLVLIIIGSRIKDETAMA